MTTKASVPSSVVGLIWGVWDEVVVPAITSRPCLRPCSLSEDSSCGAPGREVGAKFMASVAVIDSTTVAVNISRFNRVGVCTVFAGLVPRSAVISVICVTAGVSAPAEVRATWSVRVVGSYAAVTATVWVSETFRGVSMCTAGDMVISAVFFT